MPRKLRRILPMLLVGVTLLGAACSDDEASASADAATAADAGPAVDAAPIDAAASICPPEDASYRACGCGCCPDAPSTMRCLDLAHGETFASVEAADHAAASSPGCAMAGCSAPIVYVCCP